MAKALPDADLAVFVNDLIHLLELDHVADWMVGSESSGIPRGERKRYTIGVELVTNPSVLFLGMHSSSCVTVLLCMGWHTLPARAECVRVHSKDWRASHPHWQATCRVTKLTSHAFHACSSASPFCDRYFSSGEEQCICHSFCCVISDPL